MEQPSTFIVDMDYERRELRRNRTIILSGDIDCGISYQFIEDMHLLLLDKESKEPITVIISSGGGDVFSGNAIIRSIRQAQKAGLVVIGDVYGHACSMAFFIVQCCDERRMGRLCSQMAHGVTTGFHGDIKNLDAEKKLLDYWHHEFAHIVADRCNTKENCDDWNEPGFWHEILRDNTPQWYNSEECLEMGLVDEIYD